jgi:two-component system, LytTR family, response regulator
MKVILVDDEKSMLLIMRKMISNIAEIDVVGSFQSAGDAYRFIKENKVDMAFVDIIMPEESGLDFARRVTTEIVDIAIVFMTAHREFALEAFDVHAFDYIIKPISQARLEKSIQRAKQRYICLQPVREDRNLTKLSVYCLGNMEVISKEGALVHFSSSKSCELLAYLIFKNGKFVSKWRVMEDVFRGMPPQNAETYLNTTIYKLRKALEPHGMKSVIISANESYKVDIKNMYIDFIDFEKRITLFPDCNESNLKDILEIERNFAGELFGEKDYYWCLPEKERISEMYWSFAKNLAGYLVESNQLTAAIQVLKKLAYKNELDEDINCLLIRAYAAQRDRVSMERQYMRYKKVLQRELGVAPGNMAFNLYNTFIKSLK